MKTEFLAQLAHKLRVLPADERRDALEYYEGYIADAQSEEEAIAALGSPSEVAANILADYVARDADDDGKKSYKHTKTAWFLILALFAVPVGLPILIGVAATTLGLFVALAAVVFSFFVAGGAVIFAGILSLVATPFVMMQSPVFALFTLGYGLASIGFGIFFVKLARFCMGGFKWIARFAANKIRARRGAGEAEYVEAEQEAEYEEADAFDLNRSNDPTRRIYETDHYEADHAEDSTPTPLLRRIYPFSRVALALVVLGVAAVGVAFASGVRGGNIHISGGGIVIEGSGAVQYSHVELPAIIPETININTRAANVNVRQGDELRLYVRGATPEITAAQGIFSINLPTLNEAHGRGLNLSFGYTPARRMVLYIPPAMENFTLNVDVTSGNVRAYHFRGENLILRTRSGNVRVNDSVFTNGNIQTQSGNINVLGGEIYQLNARASSGNVTVSAVARRGAQAVLHANSGNVRFTETSGTVRNLAYNISVRSGNIRVNDNRYRGNASRTALHAPDISLEISTRSGNVTVSY